VRRGNSDWILLLLGVLSILSFPQFVSGQQVSFTAQVSDRQVIQNGVFDIQFELSNAQGSGFQPPAFTDFKVVGGPSRGQSTTIINGAVSSSESWSYSLLATKKGKFTIGPASIIAGRKKLSTDPVTIEVVEGKNLAQNRGGSTQQGDVILIAETDKKDYYPGQQIILNYRLLFNQNISSLDILSEDEYADFFVQNFADFDKQPSIVKVNGKDYTSRIIKSLALFPHQSGTYVIDPLIMSVGINAPFSGFQGFFSMHRMEELKVASDSLVINVLPLPANAPINFRGAVGQYTLKTFPGNVNITTDDALDFQIELHGNGDAKRWDPPSPVTDTVFEVYDPKILEDQQLESGGYIDNRRNIEYQLIPKQPGRYKVYVPFTYFDPDKKQFLTISSDTLYVQVRQGTHAGGRFSSEEDDAFASLDIEPVHFSMLSDRFWLSWPHLFLFGLILSGSCWAWLVSRRARIEGRISRSEKIRNAAAASAIAQLDELLQQSSSLDTRSFFEKATEVYYRFLCERLIIPPSELDESSLPGYLEKGKLTEEVRERVLQFFRACLPVRYGGAPSGYSREDMVEECKGIIAAL
jgi:hypothetical protein